MSIMRRNVRWYNSNPCLFIAWFKHKSPPVRLHWTTSQKFAEFSKAQSYNMGWFWISRACWTPSCHCSSRAWMFYTSCLPRYVGSVHEVTSRASSSHLEAIIGTSSSSHNYSWMSWMSCRVSRNRCRIAEKLMTRSFYSPIRTWSPSLRTIAPELWLCTSNLAHWLWCGGYSVMDVVSCVAESICWETYARTFTTVR